MAEELVTKSARLTPAEAEALAELAERLHCSEGSLLKRFAAEGLHQAHLGEGILNYVRGQATLARAARLAGLPEKEFGEPLRLRGIVGPGALGREGGEDADPFLTSLRQIGESLGNRPLVEAVERVEARRHTPVAHR